MLFNRELRTKIPTCTDHFVTEMDKKYKVVLQIWNNTTIGMYKNDLTLFLVSLCVIEIIQMSLEARKDNRP